MRALFSCEPFSPCSLPPKNLRRPCLGSLRTYGHPAIIWDFSAGGLPDTLAGSSGRSWAPGASAGSPESAGAWNAMVEGFRSRQVGHFSKTHRGVSEPFRRLLHCLRSNFRFYKVFRTLLGEFSRNDRPVSTLSLLFFRSCRGWPGRSGPRPPAWR